MPSSSIAFARARMPMPLAFSVRKSSSMMMMGKRNLTGRSPQGTGELLQGACDRRGATTGTMGDFKSNLRQGDTDLALVLAATVAIRRFADVVGRGLEEDHLRDAFVRVDLRGQRRRVREFERDKALPFRLERSHVDDDAAAGIGALPQADRKHVAWNAEVLDC